MGVDGLPIPGVKGCISGILKIIEQEELREANIETFKGLVDKVTQFERVTVERLSKQRNIPEGLKNDVRVLAEKMQNIPAQYEERIDKPSKMRRLKIFISASAHAEALNKLGEDLKNAIEEFQTALLVNMHLADMKRDADRLIDKLPVERKSFYDAHRERPIELCEPDSRVSVLTIVADWAEDTGPDHPRILWLNGRAGVGKSTIAKTLATRFDARKTLGGSFMFSKPNGVTDGSIVFTTLAYQLAHHLPDFRDHLVAAIEAKEASIKAEIPKQFEDLLAAPLSQVQSSPVTVIILDALDECTPETLMPVLTCMVENIIRFPFLRIMITSRPENPIREVIQRFTGRIREVNVGDIPTSEDIETYLQRRLKDAYSRLIGGADQNEAWPTKHDLAALVDMAGNLFIYAATAVRFIGDERVADPRRRLEIILRGQHEGQKHPFSNLDIMYREILRDALPEDEEDLHERFQAVVGAIIFSRHPHSVDSLAELLAPKYTATSIRHSLKFLHSVLIVPAEDEKAGLQVYHKSFADFITDSKRCALTEAYLRSSAHHARLCLRHLAVLESMSHTTLSPDSNTSSEELVNSMTPEERNYRTSVARTALAAVLNGINSCLYHLVALKDEVIKDDKAEAVIPLAQGRIETFLQSLRRYKKYLGALLMDNDQLRQRYRRIEARLKRCLETRRSADVYVARLLAAMEEEAAVAPVAMGDARA